MTSTPIARRRRRSRRCPSFVVNGAAQGCDAALTTASAEMTFISGISLAATFEGEFSDVTHCYAGRGVVRSATLSGYLFEDKRSESVKVAVRVRARGERSGTARAQPAATQHWFG
jgi:hypothetical protein